jgi:hypothetical protein
MFGEPAFYDSIDYLHMVVIVSMQVRLEFYLIYTDIA